MSKKNIPNPKDEELKGGNVLHDQEEKIVIEDFADVQAAADMASAVEKPKARAKKQLSDEEIILTARRGEQLSADDLERLRKIPGPNGEKGAYKDLWTKHEFRYGPKVEVYIDLPQGEADERVDNDGNVSYPMEYTSLNGVRCFIPKGVDAEVPKIVADVLKPYLKSLRPPRRQMRNISKPTFHFE